jgi:hypothetical protein
MTALYVRVGVIYVHIVPDIYVRKWGSTRTFSTSTICTYKLAKFSKSHGKKKFFHFNFFKILNIEHKNRSQRKNFCPLKIFVMTL